MTENEEDLELILPEGDEPLPPPPTQEKMEAMIRAEDAWRKRRFKAEPEPVSIPAQEVVRMHATRSQEAEIIARANSALSSLYQKVQGEMDRELQLPFEKAKKLMNEIMKAYGFGASNFRLDQTNIAWILNQMIYWAMYDQKNCEWDVNKGIYLYGKAGRGKTQLMKFLSGFTYAIGFRHADLVHVKAIMIDLSDARSLGPLKRYLVGKWIFNDIGWEDDDKLMGNKVDLVDRVFSIRADDGRLTHATGNVPPEKFAEVYGKRIDSRMNELFTFQEVTGPWDFRKDEWKKDWTPPKKTQPSEPDRR